MSILNILENLTGQEPPFKADHDQAAQSLLNGSGIGHSQFNELMLLCGYDRVTPWFFQFLLDGTADYTTGNAFTSLQSIIDGIEKLRIRAILRFGNVKFAFKYLSTISEEDFRNELGLFDQVDESEFTNRHDPLVPIEEIPGAETYYLGYLIKRELDERLERDPNDSSALAELKKRVGIVELGKKNHNAYLAYDHMDVYVATSMRNRHEYQMVSQVVDEVFSSERLKKLKVRWFDPTQAYCEDRIDKGLVEGLMLKRATCTLYLAQESDTLGKDSELASTLAQGKPVIAYIPSVDEREQENYVDQLLKMVREGTPDKNEKQLILQQLQVFCPAAAWNDTLVMSWVADNSTMDSDKAKKILGDCIRKHYETRANTLKQSHPLGIQVHLETGVSNGVLVARSTAECAELIKRVLTNTLEFKIVEKTIDNNRYLLLEESVSKSVFRAVTGDRYLTNSFWNFYLPK